MSRSACVTSPAPGTVQPRGKRGWRGDGGGAESLRANGSPQFWPRPAAAAGKLDGKSWLSGSLPRFLRGPQPQPHCTILAVQLPRDSHPARNGSQVSQPAESRGVPALTSGALLQACLLRVIGPHFKM